MKKVHTDFYTGVRGAVWRAVLSLPRDATNRELAALAGVHFDKSVTRALRELEDHGDLKRIWDPVTGTRYIEILRRPNTQAVVQ